MPWYVPTFEEKEKGAMKVMVPKNEAVDTLKNGGQHQVIINGSRSLFFTTSFFWTIANNSHAKGTGSLRRHYLTINGTNIISSRKQK